MEYRMTIPVCGGKQWGRLLSDPRDETHLYFIGINEKRGLYRINLATNSLVRICTAPEKIDEYNAVLVSSRPDYGGFVIVASVEGGSWFMYSSTKNSWKELTRWKPAHSGWILSYLVYAPSVKTFYYHVHGSETWEIVEI